MRRAIIIIGLLAGVVLLGFVLWDGSTGDGSDAPVSTIAVLPFKPLVLESRNEALEVGMADSLIARLSNIRELTVRPLGVVRRYGTSEQNPFSAGRELGVEAVLDGHIHRSADRIRVALGWIDFYYEWDWRSAEANYQRAVQLNPHDFSAHLGYAHLLSITSRHEDALREVNRALALEPRSPLAGTLKGQFLFHARRYGDAAEQLRSTLESHPTFWIALLHRGRVHERDRHYEEALADFSRARESGGSWAAVSLTGFTQAVSGQHNAAERTLSELRAAGERTYVPPYNVALVYQGRGTRRRS